MADFIERSEHLGNAVWMRRDRELGLSREALARRLGWSLIGEGKRSESGWSPKTIVRIERAQRGVRSMQELNALADALGLTSDQLIARVAQAESTPRTGEADGISDAIAGIRDEELRAIVRRIADDLAGLARALGDRGPE
jgi:transcriptional regulator with XRE-family HTH domain